MSEFPNSETLLLIDGDILLYSVGWGSEDVEDEWVVDSKIESFFARLFDSLKVYNYKVYLTGKGNFREGVAKSHKYKGKRKKEKPHWYPYIKDYLIHMYDTVVCEGYEADDGMAMHMTRNPNSICCSIDKDLLMVEGWHYSWATHNREEMPLRYISNEGFIELEQKAKKKKIKGGGYPWFFCQMLLGDITDAIFGVKGYGDVKVYNALKDCNNEEEYLEVVKGVYQEGFGERWKERLLENADLLWMVQKINNEGELLTWSKMNSHKLD